MSEDKDLPARPTLRACSPDGGGRTQLLEGMTVMIVEDEYQVAMEYAIGLERSGAKVMGPYSESSSAMRVLMSARPDCAVLDLNLRDGFHFALATTLRSGNIPVVIATGYDPSIIPWHLKAHLTVLQKPVERGQLVSTLACVTKRLGSRT